MFAAFMSNTTHSCPPRIRRRAMLAPIRPSPISPSWLFSGIDSPLGNVVQEIHVANPVPTQEQHSSSLNDLLNLLRQRFHDCSVEHSESGRNFRTKMHAQGAPASLHEHGKIAARLRRFHHSESKFLSRDRKILGVVASDLQKDSRVRPAFVCLTGRMKEPWSKAEAGRDLLLVPHSMPDLLQAFFMLCVHLDECERGEIISGLEASKMGAEI